MVAVVVAVVVAVYGMGNKRVFGGFLVPRDVALAMLLLVLTLMVSGTYLLSIRFP